MSGVCGWDTHCHQPRDRYAWRMTWTRLEIDLNTQQLLALEANGCTAFPCSTAARGAGEREGSQQTPRGVHRVRARIGAGLETHAVLVGRRPTVNIGPPRSPNSGRIVTGFSVVSCGSAARNPVLTVAGIGIANDDLFTSMAPRPLSRSELRLPMAAFACTPIS